MDNHRRQQISMKSSKIDALETNWKLTVTDKLDFDKLDQ